MKTNDEFDNLLYDALTEYRDAEPLAGLEDRVLRRVRCQAERRRATRLAWSAAAVATATLLTIVAWLGLRERVKPASVPVTVVQKSEAAPQVQKKEPEIAEVSPGVAVVAKKKIASPRHRRQPNETAKELSPIPAQFPTPEPLTANERALLALAQKQPEALQTLPQDNSEIAIAPIEIKPLADEDAAGKGDN